LVYTRYSGTFELFARAAAKSEFEKLKQLLGVTSKDQLVEKINQGIEKFRVNTWQVFTYGDANLNHLLGLDQLDSLN
ncbi:MAG: hypothetical protein HZA91_17040, partial [Verrucomicrobia bacterium]|nr:hypothetical protein [Verrucomicrobiota bacterium]